MGEVRIAIVCWNECYCTKVTKYAKETKELPKVIEDLRRDISAQLRDINDSIQFSSHTCDGLQCTANEVKKLRKEPQAITPCNMH